MNPVAAIRKTDSIHIAEVDPSVIDRIQNGRVLETGDLEQFTGVDGEYALIDSNQALQAVVRVAEGQVSYRFVVASRSPND